MNWLAIVLVSLLALYIVLWAVDRWIVQPRRQKNNPQQDAKRDELPRDPRQRR